MSPSDRGPHTPDLVAAPNRAADTRRMAEALSDPLRADIFDTLSGWLPNATAQQIAEFLGEAPDAVARELAVLEDSDLVERLTPSPERPGDSPPYRTTREGTFTDEQWAEFPPELRRRFLARLLDRMSSRIRGAIGKGGFDAVDVHVSWLPTELDGIGYSDMVRLLVETIYRAQDIQAASVQRRADGTADDVEVKSSVMLIHFLDDASPAVADEDAMPALAQAFGLSDEIADEVAGEDPDWHKLAEAATELARVARRRARANIVR